MGFGWGSIDKSPCLTFTEQGIKFPTPHNPGVKGLACNLNTWEVEAGGSRVKVLLGYLIN